MTGAIDLSAHLHLKLVDIDITLDDCLVLDCEHILDEDVSGHGSPEIHILASKASCNPSLWSYHDFTLGEKLSLNLTVYTDIAVRGEFSLDSYAHTKNDRRCIEVNNRRRV